MHGLIQMPVHPPSLDNGRLRAAWRRVLENQSEKFAALSQSSEGLGGVEALLTTLSVLIDESRSADQALLAVSNRKSQLMEQLGNLQRHLALSTSELAVVLLCARSALSEAEEGMSRQEDSLRDTELDHVGLLLGRLGLLFFETAMRTNVDADLASGIVNLDYALLYERTRQLAITDALTGLYNYGYFLERLTAERARAERYQRLLSLILIDVDSFKLYNDTYGHPAGNELLRHVAESVASEVREVDLVARFGGEEFAVLAPEANRLDARHLAERIRRRIADAPIPHGRRTTVSAGVATYPIDAGTAESLVKAADSGLYAAKEAGRNCTVSFAPATGALLRYRPDRAVRNVSLVGSFNGWDRAADPMVPREDGTFELTIRLRPGTYQYKFVLDGDEWIAVPHAERAPDNFGGENNVLRLTTEPCRD